MFNSIVFRELVFLADPQPIYPHVLELGVPGVASMTALTIDQNEAAGVRDALAQFQELGGLEFVGEMIELMNQQTPQQFDAIEKALASGDMATAQRHAHSMKSSFGNFGATTCQELATDMDRAGKDGDAETYRAGFDRLKIEFSKLQALLKDVGKVEASS
jgi:HPt (histidine-containing phosphotransfer) domain-containing protein